MPPTTRRATVSNWAASNERVPRASRYSASAAGAQLVNVFLGGRLRRDLAAFYEEGRAVSSILPRKRIFVEPGSALARALGRTQCRVNALHRQAIDDRHLGDGLVVVAHEASGVVQAVESNGPWHVLGVQWHPEYMPQRREQLGLFASLVANSQSRAAE